MRYDEKKLDYFSEKMLAVTKNVVLLQPLKAQVVKLVDTLL